MHALIGRDDELRSFVAALGRASDGNLIEALVEGPAGIGKSALLAAVADELAAMDFEVLAGRGDDLERDRPLRALSDAVGARLASGDDQRAHVARTLAGIDTPDGADVAAVACDLVGTLLESHALHGPVLLVLDDLQWVDDATVVAIRTLVARLADLPIGVLLAARPAPRAAALATMFGELRARGSLAVQLGPLDQGAVNEIGARELGITCTPELESDLARAGGNPFYVRQLLASLVSSGALGVRDGRVTLAERTLPPDLRATLVARVQSLPEESRSTLRIAAVLGSSFTAADLAVVLSRSAVELLPAMEPALQAGLVVSEADRLSFAHDLIREAVYEDIPPAVRSAMHFDLAVALERAGAPLDELTHHLIVCARAGDRRAVDLLARAALAPVETTKLMELCQLALELLPRDHPDRDLIVGRLAGRTTSLGRYADAQAMARAALDRPHDPRAEFALYGAVWASLLEQGKQEELLDATAPLRFDDGDVEARRLTVRSFALFQLGRHAEARAETVESLARLGDRVDQFTVALESLLSVLDAYAGHVGRAVDHARRSAELRARVASWTFPPLPPYGLVAADRLEEATRDLDSLMRRYTERGLRSPLPVLHGTGFAQVAFAAGDLDAAATEAEAAITIAAGGRGSDTLCEPHGYLLAVAVYRGELDQATELVAAGDAVPPGPGHDRWMWARALFKEATGVPGAHKRLAASWSAWQGVVDFPLAWRSVLPTLARLAKAAGDRATVEMAVACADEGARRAGGVTSADAAAARCRGFLEGDPALLVDAADLFARGGRTLDAAITRIEAAEALKSRDRSRAIALATAGNEAFAAVGADGLVASASALLNRLGSPTAMRARAKFGWDSLTPAEERVAALVERGMTNPEIASELYLSRHTVVTHVRHVLSKLGMRSRVELAAAMSRRSESRR